MCVLHVLYTPHVRMYRLGLLVRVLHVLHTTCMDAPDGIASMGDTCVVYTLCMDVQAGVACVCYTCYGGHQIDIHPLGKEGRGIYIYVCASTLACNCRAGRFTSATISVHGCST